MDQNLATASLYINNLLAARGLLRNGKSIYFASPETEDGGVAGTMGRIINLVHDLVLRKDRDAEHFENMQMALRTMKSTEATAVAKIVRYSVPVLIGL
jgi:hypothetical protein